MFSGDTAPAEGIIEPARGADLLLHESNLVPSVKDYYAKEAGGQQIWEALQHQHSSPQGAGMVATKANASHLVLIHFLPGADPSVAEQQAQTTFRGDVTVASDLMNISISSAGSVITRNEDS